MANKNLTENHTGDPDYSAALATRFIGRDAELAAIDDIARMDSTQVVQVIGEGGAGKTRLLREILGRYQKEDERFSVAKEVIDFYHIANHSIEGLMDAIYRALQSDVMRLTDYAAARQKLDRHLAEPPSSGGTSPYPDLLKVTQDALVADLNSQISARRLVLVFDTAEKLVYEITDVERALGLAQEQLSIWRWLSGDFLPRLKNALVIIAGRPASGSLLADLETTSIQAIKMDLGNFGEPDALAYIDAVADAVKESEPELAQRIGAWRKQDRIDIIRKAEGRPILLALTIDCLAVSRVPLNLSTLGVSVPLQEDLTRIIQNTDRPEDDAIRAVARTRKGMTAELLARLLGFRTSDDNWDVATAKALLDRIRELSFVKSFGDEQVFLHDEIYDFIEEYIFTRLTPDETKRVLETITEYSHSRVAQARSKLEEVRENHDYRAVRKETESLQAALTDDLHYQLRANAVHGFETFYRYAEEALQANDMGLDAQLRAELLAFWAERDPTGNASNVDGLFRAKVIADSAIRWVRRRLTTNKYPEALKLADAIEEKHLIEEDQLSHLELQVWKLSAQGSTANAPEIVEESLEEAIRLLKELPSSWRQEVVLAHAYTRFGYLRRMAGRQHAAIDSYVCAIPLWRNVNLDVMHAYTLNNMAFALSNIGNFDRAKRLAKDAYEMRVRLGNRSAIGLSLNAWALIEMQHGDLHHAESLSKLALGQFKDSGDQRGIALAQVALAEIRRRQATEGEQLPAATIERLLKQAIGNAKAASEGFKRIKERVRQVEALIQLGCAYRDLMHLYREHPGLKSVEELAALARKTFGEARKLVDGKGLQTLDAWVREAWTDYYLASYYRRISKDRNLALAEEAISQVHACLAEANRLIDTHYGDYWIAPGQGWGPRDKTKFVIPVLTQIAKIELLKGQMAFNRFENCRAEIEGECPEAESAIREGVGHYTLSMEYDHIASPGFNFRDMRRAKDRIYERLKKLNASEWQVVYEAVSKTETDFKLPIGESAISRFLEQNFGSKKELKPIPEAGGGH